MNILCLNSGSSSLKFAAYACDGHSERRVLAGAIEALGSGHAHGWLSHETGRADIGSASNVRDAAGALEIVYRLADHRQLTVDAVGHRVVFGGDRHSAPATLDSDVLADLQRLSPFAPEHMPAALSSIAVALKTWPSVPHVACFDTAFHHRMPEIARRLPLTREYWDSGVRRYGFHGLSYEYIVSTLQRDRARRLVIAHLGHGSSMAAVLDGKPLDTTMGLTPTGGLMMSTRTGDLDPGVVLYLIREKRLDLSTLERLLTHEAGLLAVSGMSGDMQELLNARPDSPDADLAIAMFCYHARKHIAALTAALGGIDMLVFTGGVGEHAAAVRQEICQNLGHLGIEIDLSANQRHATDISSRSSTCAVRVIPTDENLMIARHTYQRARGS